jgi:predicted P-loop ATPase
LDELETLNKSALGTLKSIMTWKSSRVRRPYAHFAEQLIRRASFVGSINRGNFLTDETGTRRFLVVEIEAIDMQKGVDMDQVHAQAYSLYKSGYRYWFDQDEIATVNQRNKEFMIDTTEGEFVAQYCTVLQTDAQGNASVWVSATEVAQQIAELGKYSVSKSSARDFGYALGKAGCPKKKVGGVTKYAVQVAELAGHLWVSGGVPTHQVGSKVG